FLSGPKRIEPEDIAQKRGSARHGSPVRFYLSALTVSVSHQDSVNKTPMFRKTQNPAHEDGVSGPDTI
ncbi:MAG TPA: hypothetical protein VKN37_03040, partial [Roseovarius sp.]|nr:hypothetical protein [Roseovarius sp.]